MALSSLRMAFAATPVAADLKSCFSERGGAQSQLIGLSVSAKCRNCDGMTREGPPQVSTPRSLRDERGGDGVCALKKHMWVV